MTKKYLLDTNILIDLGRKETSVIKLLEKINIEECEICNIVTAEYFQGLYMAKNINFERDWYRKFIEAGEMKILPFDEKCAKKYGEIQAKYLKLGKLRPLFDLVIASVCMVNNLTLVTKNVKDFEMIERLKIYKEK